MYAPVTVAAGVTDADCGTKSHSQPRAGMTVQYWRRSEPTKLPGSKLRPKGA